MITEEDFENELPLIEIAGNVLLFFLVFGMSATVDINNVEEQLANKAALGTGVFLQFAVLPFLGFAAVKLLKLNEAVGITLLVVTSSPGGSYSNWWCSVFNGDLALSITMTSVSTLLSLAMLPINLILYTSTSFDTTVVESIDWGALFIALFVVVSGILLGLYCSVTIKYRDFQTYANKLGNLAGLSLVIFSFMIVPNEEESVLERSSTTAIFGIAFPCVAGLILANIISSYANIPKPERVTVAVECCCQNVGIASSVAMTMFKDSDLVEALSVPLYYGLFEALTVGMYCVCAWNMGWTKAPSSENVCTVIATNYEGQTKARPRDMYDVIL